MEAVMVGVGGNRNFCGLVFSFCRGGGNKAHSGQDGLCDIYTGGHDG